MRRLELEGQIFGYWTVLSSAGSLRGSSAWNCVCQCGKQTVVTGHALKSGNSKSCGCWAVEVNILKETTHGMTKTPLYRVWRGMKTRCYDSNAVSHKTYGARGIAVCDEWLNSFETFHADMHDGYRQGLTIERKDVNKNYSKDNCCWIPKSEQSKNRTNTIWVKTKEGIFTVTDAAKLAGVSWFCMYNRHMKGVSEDKILLPKFKAGRSFANG